jgi:hypothetical protein
VVHNSVGCSEACASQFVWSRGEKQIRCEDHHASKGTEGRGLGTGVAGRGNLELGLCERKERGSKGRSVKLQF